MYDAYDSQCLYYFVYVCRRVYVCRVRAEFGLHKFDTAKNTFVQIALSGNWIRMQICSDECEWVSTREPTPTPFFIMNLHFACSLKVLQTTTGWEHHFSCGWVQWQVLWKPSFVRQLSITTQCFSLRFHIRFKFLVTMFPIWKQISPKCIKQNTFVSSM